ncbi:hypothetical protein NPIL_152241, partial [Nephila pilipes]
MGKEVNNIGKHQDESEQKQIDGNVIELQFPHTPEKSQYINGCTDKVIKQS